MMTKATEALADWLIKCNVVKETDKDLYKYAAYSFLLSISPLLLASILGVCMSNVKQSIAIIIPFMIIRKFSGGYHTKHLWTCLLCSSLLMIICIALSQIVVCGWKLLALTACSGISLFVFSPLDNENRVLEHAEKICYKKVTTFLVVLFILLGIILHLVGLHIYAACIFIGIMLSAGMQIPNVLKSWSKAI